MAVRPPSSDPFKSPKYRKLIKQKRQRDRARQSVSRHVQLERLEERALMAIGPELFAIRPDNGVLLEQGALLNSSPRELKFLFRGGAQIDPASITNGVVVRRSGGDGLFDPLGASTTNDVVVTAGFIGLGDTSNEIVFRPASTMPDDAYRITVIGGGGNPLRNTTGEPASGGSNVELTFDLDLGPQVVAVVPQPIGRLGAALTQSDREIQVYFNDDDFATAPGSPVTSPRFYQLVATNDTTAHGDDIQQQPTSVVYDSARNVATLTFANPLRHGTYHLRIGTSDEPNAVRGTALNLGSLANADAGALEYSVVHFLGDENGVNDADLFRIDLQGNAVLSVSVNPQAGNNTLLRLFDQIGNPLATNDAGAAGQADTLVFNAGAAGQTVYLGVSSSGNSTYSPVTGSTGTGGTTTGSYRLDLSVTTLTTFSDLNSSFATASNLGFVGLGGQKVTGNIQPQFSLNRPASPGGNDEPGHRHIPVEDHLGEYGYTLGQRADLSPAISTFSYNFDSVYGRDPQNNVLLNGITENQKNRAREIFELYSRYLGIQFIEVDCTGSTPGICPGNLTIATGDIRAVDPNLPPNGPAGVAGGGLLVMNDFYSPQFGNSEYGGLWFDIAFHEIGHALGLGHSYELPSVQGAGLSSEGVYPGDHDIVHGRRIHRLDGTDVDLYKLELTEAGVITAETIAERLVATSGLDSALRLYEEPRDASGNPLRDANGNIIRRLIAQNDDFFSNDSQISLALEAGVYYLGVSSTGNTSYDPAITDSGDGGTTQGPYDLKLSFQPTPRSALVDATGQALDGDADGVAGGAYSFWFQAGPTIFVDKANDTTAGVDGNGSLASPLDNIASALAVAANRVVMPIAGGQAIREGDRLSLSDGINPAIVLEFDSDLAFSGTRVPFSANDTADALATSVRNAINGLPGPITATSGSGIVTITGAIQIDRSGSEALMQVPNPVRIVGNGGTDGSLTTPADARPYVLGFDNVNVPQRDGIRFEVPQATTVMVDAGALLKVQKAHIEVGSSAQGVNRGQASLQILGVPGTPVYFRSLRDDSLGGNSDGAGPAPQGGDWGGIAFRPDSDHELSNVFLSTVQFANMRHGGGKVTVNTIEDTVAPVQLFDARPSIVHTTVTNSASAPISADPDSFDDAQNRLGPDIHGNTFTANSLNGMLIRTRSEAGGTIDELDRTARWNDLDVVHLVPDNLFIAGTPGGPLGPIGAARARLDARLAIDPGVVVKLSSSRIEVDFGAQLVAEGTSDRPIVITSISDDRFGVGGTFDSKNDGSLAVAVPGDWGGLLFLPNSSGSVDKAIINYGGGLTPVGGAFDSFNTIEIRQADVRVANSLIENNGAGLATTNRDGIGRNVASVIYAVGAQPIVVDNILRANADTTTATTIAAISINANSMISDPLSDPGPTRTQIEVADANSGNRGPLFRGNRFDLNELNGLEVRAEELTTESVWDDTDIVHVVRGDIRADNFHTFGGLRLQSSASESLVVKFSGPNTGLTASGTALDIDDRIGGSVQVMGEPGYPVILTSLTDCFVGAGFTPDGRALLDTLSSGACEGAAPVGNSGSVIIDGGDRDDHGSATAGPDGQLGTADDQNQDGWLFIEQMIRFALSGARNKAINDILAIGVDATGGGGFGQQARSSIQSAARVLGLNVTLVNDAQISTVNFNDYKILYVPSDFFNVGGGISNAEIALLAARKQDIQNFINSGGSLVALTEDSAATPYSWLELPLPFQIVSSGFGTQPLRKTQAAIDAGFTISDASLNAGDPYHNQFIGPPGFNGLVPFFVNSGPNNLPGDADDQVITLGLAAGSFGVGVTNPSNPGDWRGIKLENLGNDRNVVLINESERSITQGLNQNGEPLTAQFLGNLAPNEKSGDDKRRLGFEVHGAIAFDNSADVDVYSFSADAGTEVWIDVDRTKNSLDTMLELVTENGVIIAQSLDNNTHSGLARNIIRDTQDGVDWYTTNPRDASMRVVLPGSGLSNYFVRVRSQPVVGNESDINGGQSRGEYQLQVRLRQADEHPGSSVRLSDIRYATNGVLVEGGPAHSLLTGEASEVTTPNNDPGLAQNMGNLLESDRNTLSVSGGISAASDVDFYRFAVDYDEVQAIGGVNGGGKTFPVVIDLDYADGLTRADTTISVFDATGRLIYVGRDSDIVDDQPKPGEGIDVDDQSRGSVGKLDPYIGTIQIPAGVIPAGSSQVYTVAVSSNGTLPSAMSATFQANPAGPFQTTRLEPVDSVQRIVEDHIGLQGFTSGNALLSRRISPQTGPILDIASAASLSLHVTPLKLSDLQLYLATSNELFVMNPFNGGARYRISGLPNNPATTDLAFKSDGRLYSTQNDPGNNAGVAGELNQLDHETGGELNSNNINVPDAEVTTNQVDALAFTRDRSSARVSVRSGGGSVLYSADPNTANVTAAPFGQLGTIVGAVGITTGLAFDRNGILFGVSSAGQFYQLAGTFANVLSDVGVGLTGLTLGPQNLENGAYRDTFFATTSDGRMVAISRTGALQNVFDTNNNGVADSAFVRLGVGGAVGLAFSPLDFNLWHPTTRRGNDGGHGINPAPDQSRISTAFDVVLPDGKNQNEQQGGASFYFGLEQFSVTPPYMRYNGGGQYGVLTPVYQQDLTSNGTVISNNYNLPGGAYGSLTTSSFGLEGFARTDKPTLYFNYFLETENAPGTNAGNTFRDSARVYVSSNNGVSWQLLATNNSLLSSAANQDAELPNFISTSRDTWPARTNQRVQELFDNTGAWRQARIDLADFAGLPNLRLRFDFSTSGRINDPTLPNTIESVGVGPSNIAAGLANAFEGFYIDDVVVGLAERGEMVTGAPADASFFALPARPVQAPPELLTGNYQLEVRRGTDYVSGFGGLGQPINGLGSTVSISTQFDSNDRLQQGRSIIAPAGTGISDGQIITVNDGLVVRTFEFDNDNVLTNASNVRIAFSGTETRGTIADRIATAINAVPNFGVTAIAKSAFLNNPTVDLSGATDLSVTGPNIFADVYKFTGDANVRREQGQILIESNVIRDANQFGINVTNDVRQLGLANSFPGAVQSTPTLNGERLAPGVVIENNLIVASRQGGISFGGDPNTFSPGPVPFGRIVNNTIFGGETPTGTGLRVTSFASPTVLNNVFSSLATAIDTSGNGTPTVVVGVNLFHANVSNGTIGTDAILLADTDPLFLAAGESNFYLASGSLAIDSAVNNLADRAASLAVKSPLGIGASPILAPDRDVFGQLRIDDPLQNPPPGLGANIFKDRGAVDRADTLSPFTVLTEPLDNDGAQADIDPNLGVIHLPVGIVSKFALQLSDGRGASLPFEGSNLNSATIDTESVRVLRNGELLRPGVDFNLGYSSTSNTILLTPLSDIWQPDSVYVVTLNNQDRFVALSPDPATLRDGDQFQIEDNSGNNTTFEYDSGYSVQFPETLRLHVPSQGAGAGGIADGQRFTISNGVATATFEFDRNNNSAAGNIRVPFANTSSANDIANALVTALTGQLNLRPVNLGGGAVHLGSVVGHSVTIPTTTNLSVTGQPGSVRDGQRLTIRHGGVTRRFEVSDTDVNNTVTPGSIPVQVRATDSNIVIANAFVAAIQAQFPSLSPAHLGDGLMHVGGINDTANPANSTTVDGVDIASVIIGRTGVTGSTVLSQAGPLSIQVPLVGAQTGGVTDGERFTISRGAVTQIFEMDSNGAGGGGGVRLITFNSSSTVTEIANAIVTSIQTSTLGVSPIHRGGGLIDLRATGNVTLSVVGPGLRSLGKLTGLSDGETFTITRGSTSVTFEFDNNNAIAAGNTAISFSTTNTRDQIADAIVNVVSAAGLGLTPVRLPNGDVNLNDTPRHTIQINGTSLTASGVPGGAVAVPLNPTAHLTSDQFAGVLINVINTTNKSDANARPRGGNTFFVDNVSKISFLPNVFISAIEDIAGNPLRANQPTGETEFTIILGNVPLDFGDARDSLAVAEYQTLQVNDGARHILSSSSPLFLGERVDSDRDGQPTTFADGDDADQSVVVSSSNLLPLPVAPITIQVNRGTLATPTGTLLTDGQNFSISDGVHPTVVFEFDLNGGGVSAGRVPIVYFATDSVSNITDRLVIAILDQMGRGNLSGFSPQNLGGGTLSLKGDANDVVNLSNAPILSVSNRPPFTARVPSSGVGAIADGQTLTISDGENPSLTFEFDDTSLNNGLIDAARRPILFNGATYDPNMIAQQIAVAIQNAVAAGVISGISASANGDVVTITNSSSTSSDDDDGLVFHRVLSRSFVTPVTATASGPGLLDGWIDFNRDGDWSDVGEQVFVGTPLLAGPNALVITTPQTAIAGDTYARFRISSTGGLFPAGIAIGGEVEDYLLTIVPGDPPVVVGDEYTQNEDSLLTVAPAGVLGNDTDANSDPMLVFNVNGSVANVGIPILLPSGATLTMNRNGGFEYDPRNASSLQRLDGGASFLDTFTYQAIDLPPGGATNGSVVSLNTATVTITVTGLNDAPVMDNSGTVVASSIAEDNITNSGTLISSVINSSGANSGNAITDVDLSAVEGIAVTGVDNSNGQWQYSTNGTIFVAFGLVSNTSATLLAADATTRIRFVPNAHFHGTSTFTFRAWDQTSGTNGASGVNVAINGLTTAFSVSSETGTITVISINDVPVITLPAPPPISEGPGASVAIPGITISDVDVADSIPGTIRITISVPTGRLNVFDGLAGGVTTVVGDGTGTVSFEGTPSEVNITLMSLRYTVPDADFSGPVTLVVDADDMGRTPPPPPGQATNARATLTLTVAPTNDAPVLTLPGTTSLNEGPNASSTINGLSVTDIDVVQLGGTLEVRLSIPAGAGTLTTTNQGPASNLVIVGTLAAVNAELASLRYRVPNDDFNNNTHGGPIIANVFVDDLGNAGAPGNLTASGSFTVSVVPVNDPPVVTVPVSVSIPEGSGSSFQFLPSDLIQVFDVDAGEIGGGPVLVTLSVPAGRGMISVTPDLVGGIPLAAISGNQTSSVLLSGSQSELAVTLATMTYEVPHGDFNSAANGGDIILTVTADDQGRTGLPASTTSDTEVVTISITSVNDAPFFNPGANQVVNEDAGAQSIAWATGIRAGGPLSTDENGQALSFLVSVLSPANGSAFTSISVSPTGQLNYTTAPNWNGVATVAISLSDNGGTANGGMDTTAQHTLTISVNSVNDAPEFTRGGDLILLEDAGSTSVPAWATTIRPGPLSALDESGQALGFIITRVDAGRLSFTSQPVVSPAGNLSFTPSANSNGTAIFEVSLRDDGGTARGGVDTSAKQTFTISVTAVNDPPFVANVIADQIVDEDDLDTILELFPTVFDDVDLTNEGDNLSFSVTSNSRPALVQTSVSGSQVRLDYQLNQNGQAVISVRVADSQNSVASDTFTVSVRPVNDAPFVVNPIADVTVVEDAANTIVDISAVFGDVDIATNADAVTRSVESNSNPGLVLVGLSNTTMTLDYQPDAVGSSTVVVVTRDAAGATARDTFVVNVTEVNDAPAPNDDHFTTNEDVPLSFVTSTLRSNDDAGPANEAGQGLTVTNISPTSQAGGSLVFSVAASQWIYTPPANFSGVDRFTYIVLDDGRTNGLPEPLPATGTVFVTVAAVNDRPTIGLPGNQSVSEDNVRIIPGLSAADVDAGTSVVRAALTVQRGVITLRTDVAGGLTGADISNNGTASVVINAPLARLNATLSDSQGVAYRGNLNANGQDALVVTVDDLGNSPGPSLSESKTVSISITPVNDAPSVAANANYSASEDTRLTITAVNMADVDAVEGTGTVRVTLSVDNGRIDVRTDVAGGISIGDVANNGTSAVVITSLLSRINTTFSATQGLSYIGKLNYNGTDTLAISVNDLANFPGPIELSTSRSAVISVAAVNDAPNAVADTYSISEDATLRVAGRGVLDNDTDVDSSPQSLLVDSPAGVTISSMGATVRLNSDGTFEYDPTTATALQATQAGQVVQDTFTYSARDGMDANSLVSLPATVTIRVQGVNDAPTVESVSLNGVEDGPIVSGNFVGRDIDNSEQGLLRYLIVTQPSEGFVTASGTPGNSSFNFNPGNAFQDLGRGETRLVRFTYRATDPSNQANANSTVGTVDITITGVNDTPVVGNINLMTSEEGPAVTDLFVGSDVDGELLTFSIVNGIPAGSGILTNNLNGTFTFDPAADFQGLAAGQSRVVTFTYHAIDPTFTSNSVSSLATVAITVTGVNDAPVARDDIFVESEDTVITRAIPGVLTGDTDADTTDVLRVINHDSRSLLGAVVSVADNGSFSYDPRNSSALQALSAGAQLVDSFRYTISDPAGATSSATVTITVTGVNDAPTARPDSGSTSEDSSLTFEVRELLGNDSDPDSGSGGFLEITGFSATSIQGATISRNGSGDFVFDPRTAPAIQSLAVGGRLVDTFTYTIRDAQLATSLGTVSVTVTGLNDAPVANVDSTTAGEDLALSISAPGVLANDQDPDSGETNLLTVSAFDAQSARGAIVSVNSNGAFNYDPRTATALQGLANGQTLVDSFRYTVVDAQGAATFGTVTVTVNGANDAPVTLDDTGTTGEDNLLNIPATGLLGNDLDAEGSILSVVQVNGNLSNVGVPVVLSSGATLTVNSNGSYSYNPRTSATLNSLSASETFVDSFTYRGTDGTATSTTQGVVRITVTGANDTPLPGADQLTANEDISISQGAPGLLLNDTDPDSSDRLTITVFDRQSSRGAQVSVNPDGSFVYDPSTAQQLQALALGETALDTFRYTVSDGKGGVVVATATVTVSGQNDAPIAVNDSYAVGEDTILLVAGRGVLENDRDADTTDALRVIELDSLSARGASVRINEDGTLRYDPTKVPVIQALRSGQVIVDSVTYQVTDDITISSATIAVTVTGTNDVPQARPDIYAVEEGGVLRVSVPGVLENDFDGENDFLTAERVTNVSNGILIFAADGSFEYRPNAGFSGTDQFTYRARDPISSSPSAVVTINVNPRNDKPIGRNDTYSVVQDSTLSVPVATGVLSNDSDPDGDSLSAVLVSSTTNGSLNLLPNGSFTYQPRQGFFGTDTFRYAASDSSGTRSDPATVTINVSNDKVHRNPRNRLDVNDDGQVTPIDALQVVNDLNRFGARQLPNPPAPPNVPPPYLDVNGDGFVTPADALEVINFLNGMTGGEGESVNRLRQFDLESGWEDAGLTSWSEVVSSELLPFAPGWTAFTLDVGLPRNLRVHDRVQASSQVLRVQSDIDLTFEHLDTSPVRHDSGAEGEFDPNGRWEDLLEEFAEEGELGDEGPLDAAFRGLYG